MNCPKCGAPAAQGEKFCKNCGSEIPAAPAQAVSYTAPAQPVSYAAPAQTQPAYTPPPVYSAPAQQPSGYSPEYKPIGAWGYIGYNILFAIPIIGFILLIVFAVSRDNINRRNYARSFLLVMLIAVVLTIIGCVLAAIFGVNVADSLNRYM